MLKTQLVEEKRRRGLKPRLIFNGLRGLKGPLFHAVGPTNPSFSAVCKAGIDSTRFTARLEAAPFQEQIESRVFPQLLGFADLLGGKIAEQREFEHLSLKSLDHQNQPDDDDGERHHHGDQQHQKRSKDWDDKQHNTGEFERDGEQNSRAEKQEALDGVEAHKAILVIRGENEEQDRRDECAIGEGTRDIFGKRTDLALGAEFGVRGSSATGAEGGRVGHLSSTMRARDQRNVGWIHCGARYQNAGWAANGGFSCAS
jgi:hypothetical protein